MINSGWYPTSYVILKVNHKFSIIKKRRCGKNVNETILQRDKMTQLFTTIGHCMAFKILNQQSMNSIEDFFMRSIYLHFLFNIGCSLKIVMCMCDIFSLDYKVAYDIRSVNIEHWSVQLLSLFIVFDNVIIICTALLTLNEYIMYSLSKKINLALILINPNV